MKDLIVKQDPSAKHSLYLPPPSDHVNSITLAAGVAKVETVPALATCVLFSKTTKFYAKHNAAATVPAGDVTDGSASDLNPEGWIVTAGDTIGVISPVACTVTFAYYK